MHNNHVSSSNEERQLAQFQQLSLEFQKHAVHSKDWLHIYTLTVEQNFDQSMTACKHTDFFFLHDLHAHSQPCQWKHGTFREKCSSRKMIFALHLMFIKITEYKFVQKTLITTVSFQELVQSTLLMSKAFLITA